LIDLSIVQDLWKEEEEKKCDNESKKQYKSEEVRMD